MSSRAKRETLRFAQGDKGSLKGHFVPNAFVFPSRRQGTLRFAQGDKKVTQGGKNAFSVAINLLGITTDTQSDIKGNKKAPR